MSKYKRLMKALAEIKAICSKHDDPDLGCGKKCPFLMGKNGDDFRGCEVLTYMHQDRLVNIIGTPEEWSEE